ncbi:MAG: hypothetical protein HY916_08655 [Desulfovibrio sp.]|jgi:Tfp pilus assembly protein PilX|nr:hypothetical protein [Desulfovibrio sp.]
MFPNRRVNFSAGGNSRGFTLVEVIVIVVVTAFMGLLLVSLMGTQLTKSAAPLLTARDAARAESTMEAITAYYTQCVNNSTSGALDAVAARYPANATLSVARNASFNSVDALVVTVNEGGATLTTVFTQARNSSSDATSKF